ncbi:uncharacterized protein FTJAE_11978 [Fusarium tjaetaba]|uniref:Uncharacterized protein n=1 Tax=Fusarium tjaetaba TaxID=1567544 RepID=A0A8H5VEN1_9HYPO|nr:uncharacterized protein FTJAE_11978 [Fusarium tjaetaba]KAF5619295.1 hypothetical protein FTJAE_11978 [Fusarium tjaetaba]
MPRSQENDFLFKIITTRTNAATMANEPGDSATDKLNGRSRVAHSLYCIFNNVRQYSGPYTKPEIDEPYFATVPLEPRLFEDFRPLLDQVFQRYDYSVSDGIVTTRVGPKNHDDYATKFGVSIRRLIGGSLCREPYDVRIQHYQHRQTIIREYGTASPRLGRMRIRLRDSRAKKPGLVFLVGYSQTQDALEKVAKDYIVETKGVVTTVVCFDIKGHQRPSSVSLWHARQNPDETVEAVCGLEPAIFQDADGDHVFNDKSLVLRLSDILMETDSDECPLPWLPFHQLSFQLQFAKA